MSYTISFGITEVISPVHSDISYLRISTLTAEFSLVDVQQPDGSVHPETLLICTEASVSPLLEITRTVSRSILWIRSQDPLAVQTLLRHPPVLVFLQ